MCAAIAAVAACGGPDPTNERGTWQLTYPAAPCADGVFVELMRLDDRGRVWWPSTDDSDRIDDSDALWVSTDGVLEMILQPSGSGDWLRLEITLSTPPAATVVRSFAADCDTGRIEADVVKLEDE